MGRLPALVESYQTSRDAFQSITRETALEEVLGPEIKEGKAYVWPMKQTIMKLIVNCDSAVGYLKGLVTSVPKEVIDTLESQRKRITPIEGFDAPLFKHLSKAIDEHELGHYLAAAMIAGKSANYVNEQLNGGTEEEKVEYLVQKKLLDPNLRENFLKASRKTRNFYSHDLNAVPEPEEALNAVSDAVDMAMKYMKSKSSTF